MYEIVVGHCDLCPNKAAVEAKNKFPGLFDERGSVLPGNSERAAEFRLEYKRLREQEAKTCFAHGGEGCYIEICRDCLLKIVGEIDQKNCAGKE